VAYSYHSDFGLLMGNVLQASELNWVGGSKILTGLKNQWHSIYMIGFGVTWRAFFMHLCWCYFRRGPEIFTADI